MKVTTPVLALMANSAASAPPVIENVKVCAGKSASVALTSMTVPLPFSAKFTAAAVVITGVASLTPVTVTAIAWLVDRVPSLAVTCTS
jgi:hypothetical protein